MHSSYGILDITADTNGEHLYMHKYTSLNSMLKHYLSQVSDGTRLFGLRMNNGHPNIWHQLQTGHTLNQQ